MTAATERRYLREWPSARESLPRLALAGVIVTFVVLAAVIALKTPAWENSDEPGHVQNVETFVSGHWYRIRYDKKVGNEAHQPPLYYALLAGVQTAAGQPARSVHPGAPSFPFFSRGIYLHHTRADHRFLLWLRLPNILLGVLTITLTFFAAGQVTGDRWTPVVAAAIVAFLPRFVFLSAFVTNDNLINTLGAALLLVALRCVAVPGPWRMVAVGVVLGLIVITKLSALTALLVLLVVGFCADGSKRRAQLWAIGAAAALSVCGWYLVQNTIRYGDPMALAHSQRYLQAIGGLGTFGSPYHVHNPLHLIFSAVPSKIFNGFWYKSGWNQFRWPSTTSLIFWVALAAGLAGVFTKRAPTATGAAPTRRMMAVMVTLVVAGFASVWITAFNTATYEARLAYLGLPALACLAALGMERWKPALRPLLPVLGLCGTIVAIAQNVLAVAWH